MAFAESSACLTAFISAAVRGLRFGASWTCPGWAEALEGRVLTIARMIQVEGKSNSSRDALVSVVKVETKGREMRRRREKYNQGTRLEHHLREGCSKIVTNNLQIYSLVSMGRTFALQMCRPPPAPHRYLRVCLNANDDYGPSSVQYTTPAMPKLQTCIPKHVRTHTTPPYLPQ